MYLAPDTSDYGEGRVMVYNDLSKSWGQVCNAGWDKKDADVICRQVGLVGASEGEYHPGFLYFVLHRIFSEQCNK